MDEYAYVVNVDCAVADGGEYLFIERGPDEEHAAGLLGFPGGKVEQPPGGEETFEETAARELREEVGLEAEPEAVEYVCSSTFEADEGTRCINVVTYCDRWSGEARPRATDEVAAVHWLSPDGLDDREDVPAFTREYVDRIEAVRDSR